MKFLSYFLFLNFSSSFPFSDSCDESEEDIEQVKCTIEAEEALNDCIDGCSNEINCVSSCASRFVVALERCPCGARCPDGCPCLGCSDCWECEGKVLNYPRKLE